MFRLSGKLRKKEKITKKVKLLNKVNFEKKGTVMFIGTTLDKEGNLGSKMYKHMDEMIVIGFRTGNNIYRGLITGHLLGLSSINLPVVGKSYIFLSNEYPTERETYKLINLSGVKPAKSLITKFF